MKPLQRTSLSLPALLLLGACPAPDFPADAEPVGRQERKVVLPIFAVPVQDGQQGNGIEAVFVHVAGDQVELQVVFRDEDHPNLVVDLGYDLYRWYEYHRVHDVEGLRYDYRDFSGSDAPLPQVLAFPGTYSGQQEWDVFLAEHESAQFDASAFEWQAGRPVIYLNTWNHLYSNANNNDQLSLEFVADYPIYKGDRGAVQQLFEDVWVPLF